jgi:hypothetical protein
MYVHTWCLFKNRLQDFVSLVPSAVWLHFSDDVTLVWLGCVFPTGGLKSISLENFLTCFSYIMRSHDAGLPDGIFSYQKFQCGYILEGLGMKNMGMFQGNLEYITAAWCIVWHFGDLVYLVYIWYIWYTFGIFGIHCAKKNLATLPASWFCGLTCVHPTNSSLWFSERNDEKLLNCRVARGPLRGL